MMSCVKGGKSSAGVEARGWGLNVDMERRWKRWVGAGSVEFPGAGLRSDQNVTTLARVVRIGRVAVEVYSDLPVLADHDEVLRRVHGEVRNLEGQLVGLERDRWVKQIRVRRRRKRYQAD